MKKITLILLIFIFSVPLFVNATEYGVNSHFWQSNDWTDGVADLLVEINAEWVRSDIPSSEPPYDYSYFIPNLERAKEKGLKTLMILWHPIPFDDLDQYEDYVSAVATQLKGYVDAYEIWNEPVAQKYGWYQGEPEKYYEMLRTAYQTIKSIDSHPFIIGIG